MDKKYKIRKNDSFLICIHEIQHNRKYWIDPEKFIPERFDPESKYYLTPDGKRRPTFAYNPFAGGHRMCTGKTFSEVFAKFIVPGILGKYDFEFLDKEQMKEKPMINIDATRDPVIMVKWKRSHVF